jgi:hypothetical protein
MPMSDRTPRGRLPGEDGEIDAAAELPEDRPGHAILAEEEADEAPFHAGDPAQPADYVQEDTD